MASLTSVLLIGLIIVFFIILFSKQIARLKIFDSKVMERLSKRKWFKNPWKTGTFLFIVNAFLFVTTALFLYIVSLLFIPFLHLLIMLAAMLVSLYLWVLISRYWEGTRFNRYKMGLVGSSFYGILSLIILYRYLNLKPAFPGDDIFMAALGLFFALIVTTVAFITCFSITSFTGKNVKA
jgi:hypothetical protein